MSKIGKKTINIPAGTEIIIEGRKMTVKGSKGELQMAIPEDIEISVSDGKLKVVAAGKEPKNEIWGLIRALAANTIKGVSDGFEKNLEFQGIGYKAILKGNDLELSLGYSHPIVVKAPEGISFKVEKNMIAIIGRDKELVGNTAAEIRSKRPPEPYKGSGIRYKGEVIIKKAGKKAVTAS